MVAMFVAQLLCGVQLTSSEQASCSPSLPAGRKGVVCTEIVCDDGACGMDVWRWVGGWNGDQIKQGYGSWVNVCGRVDVSHSTFSSVERSSRSTVGPLAFISHLVRA